MIKTRWMFEIKYDLDYLLFISQLHKMIFYYDFFNFEGIILDWINKSKDIHDKLRRLYICRIWLTWFLQKNHREKWKYHSILQKNIKIQFKQIIDSQKFKNKHIKIEFIMRWWVPFFEREEDWLEKSHTNWNWFFKLYRTECKKIKKLVKPRDSTLHFRDFLLHIYNLKLANYRREEFLNKKKARNKI